MTAIYKQEVFAHLTDYLESINAASTATGISKEAIAGAIAEEYDAVLSNFIQESSQVRIIQGHMDSAIIVEHPPNISGVPRFASIHEYIAWSFDISK